MADTLLAQLNKIAFRFKIQQEHTLGRAAKISTVIKVLSDLNTAYLNFLEVEFNKNETFVKVVKNKPRVLKNLLEDLELLVVDLKFGSFEASIAPALIESHTLFRDEVLDWEKSTFDAFKSVILSGDYNETQFLQTMHERYSDVERLRIFKPLFSAFGSGKEYNMAVLDAEGNSTKSLKRPEKKKLEIYTPIIPQEKEEVQYKTSVIFAKVLDKETKSLKKGAIKDILYWEELEHDTYPFKPDLLKSGKIVYVLQEKLDCLVRYDDKYIIACPELGLTAHGASREEAEQHFAETFHALVLAAKEKDDSSKIKKRLAELVQSVHA